MKSKFVECFDVGEGGRSEQSYAIMRWWGRLSEKVVWTSGLGGKLICWHLTGGQDHCMVNSRVFITWRGCLDIIIITNIIIVIIIIIIIIIMMIGGKVDM